ncbi:cyclophilin-like protein [Testicularia cyperi]|uniref:Cyclophilin-like protein n=1 Tax=Testicularia cyperi TaxID=1882483 RepID=A0A317XF76_9BASI|nr:cyclophilin-like protein [Testicularia cyperi]
MTSQYVTEPPTSGRISLLTSKGEIEIELFAKETPKACRNILTLILEGFYDKQIFHRLVPGFIIQTGDPSGTGMGGESIYGEPFPVERHSRLKFNKRGIVAMASEEGANESQFFITLDATPELQNKHTVIGKVVGNSIFTVLELAQCEMDPDQPDRPRYPPKLLEARVLDNPFDDLKPRSTRQDRMKLEQSQRLEAQQKLKEASKKKAKKNIGLLSFGDEEENSGAPVLKGPKSSHDLLPNDKRLAKQSTPSSTADANGSRSDQEPVKKKPKHEEEQHHSNAKPEPSTSSSSRNADRDERPKRESREAEDSESRIRRLEAELRGDSGISSTASASSSSKKSDKAKSSLGKNFLAQAREKYAKQKGKNKDSDAYDALLSFQKRMQSSKVLLDSPEPSSKAKHNGKVQDDEDEGEEEMAKEYGASDDDDDWRSHRLDAGGVAITGNDKYGVDDYEVLDPRDHAKNAAERPKDRGKRGRDWVDDRNVYAERSATRSDHRHRDSSSHHRRRHESDHARDRDHDHDHDRGYDRSRPRDHRDRKY